MYIQKCIYIYWYEHFLVQRKWAVGGLRSCGCYSFKKMATIQSQRNMKTYEVWHKKMWISGYIIGRSVLLWCLSHVDRKRHLVLSASHRAACEQVLYNVLQNGKPWGQKEVKGTDEVTERYTGLWGNWDTWWAVEAGLPLPLGWWHLSFSYRVGFVLHQGPSSL